MSDEFVTVAKLADVPDGQGLAVPLGDQMVALFQLDGELFAIADACPHMGASLAAGAIEGDTVICPWHAWRFCVRDGSWCDNPSVQTDAFDVRIDGEDVQVRSRLNES